MSELNEPVEIIIKPTKGWQLIDLNELVRYRDLLYFLTLKGIKARYAQSVLGVGWAIIQPLFSTLVFTIIFGTLAKVSSEGVPYALFSLAAMVPWTYFSTTLTETANSLITNTNLINKVYFPRLVLPLSTALSKLLDFAIGLVVLAAMMAWYRYLPGVDILWIPVLILIMICSSLGVGMFLSAMAVQYRDVKHAITFLVQMLMYAAPVVYPTSNVPEAWRFWYSLNPMVGVIEGFRSALLQTQPMPLPYIASGLVVSLLLFLAGALYFRRMERTFADVA
jgi:lipopolysaccharide transport system permease protein